MKISELPTFELIVQLFGKNKPAIYLQWLQEIGVISKNSDERATAFVHASMIYFMSACSSKHEIQERISNGIPRAVTELAHKLTFHDVPPKSIFDVVSIHISAGRFEIKYTKGADFIGKQHIGPETVLPGIYFLKYWESLNI